MGLRGKRRDRAWEVFLWFCRIFGIIAALVLWGAGVEATFYKHVLGIYMIVIAVFVTALESVFVINYFVELSSGSASSRCWRVWDSVLWLDDWKKGVLYMAFSIPCYIEPVDVFLGVLAGCVLVITAVMYLLKTFKTRREQRIETIAQKPSYDRFDDLHEDIEDSIVNPNSTFEAIPTVGDQSEILEM